VTTQEEIEARLLRELQPFAAGGIKYSETVRRDVQCTVARVMLELLPRPRVERILFDLEQGKAVAELSVPAWFAAEFLG
jgi:hypothetical protein